MLNADTRVRRLKFFAEGVSHGLQQLNQLTPLLRAEMEITSDELRAAGAPLCVPDIADADFVTPSKIWGRYIRDPDLTEPLALARRAKSAGKPFVVWHTGDLAPVLPSKEWIVLTNAVDPSKEQLSWFVAPAFIDDPLGIYGRESPTGPRRNDRPRIGFCGYAASGAIKLTYSLLQNLKFHALYAAGRTMYEPPPVVPATLLRAKVLNQLRNDPGVETDFIIRSRYKFGSAAEFYGNILRTDYTVCVRGYGNWSVRLYETLACGRIPIVIDTGGGLPFDSTVDWSRYCVLVPQKEVSKVGEYVRKFHSRLSLNDLRARQQECRALWEDRLSLKGFLSHLHEYLA